MIKLKKLNASGQQSEGGYFLISVIVMITFLSAVGFSLAGLAAEQYQHTRREMYDQNAQLVAEAGVEVTVDQLNIDSTFAGYTTAQQYFNNATQGYGTYATTVTTNADNSKTIISTGKVYRHSTDASPYLTRKVRVTAVGTDSTGYSVLTGPGGLILGGSANITNSEVYVSGTITMNGSSKIGTFNNPVTVNVANDACPTGSSPGPTYPQVCTDGSQPITLAASTNIYGTVCATGQTSTGPNNNIQGGNGGAGLQLGCTAPVSTPPTYDRLAQIGAVTTTGSGTDAAYKCTGNQSITWQSNLELTGDVSVGHSCNVDIKGNVWITGNLTIGGASKITVDNTVGTTRPVVMVDGTITIGGSAAMAANSSGTGIEFISFESDNACTVGTSSGTYCSSLTGNDLKTSQTMQTINVGGAVNLAGMVFDSYWSEVVLGGSGNLGAATGQTVNMSGAGTVIFGTTLSSGTKTWAITSYQPYFGP